MYQSNKINNKTNAFIRRSNDRLMNQNNNKQQYQMQTFLFAHRLKFFEKIIRQNVKYQIFYIENSNSKNQNKQNKLKLKFVFLKIVIFFSNENFEKQNILQKKIKKINKKNSICNRIHYCLIKNIEPENNNFLNIELYLKKRFYVFLKK